MATFTDVKPPGARDEWVGGVNYSLTHDQSGYQVLGVYSASQGRYILPGERVQVCDEWGYWRERKPEVFIGRDRRGDYLTEASDGATSRITWRVVRDVIPA